MTTAFLQTLTSLANRSLVTDNAGGISLAAAPGLRRATTPPPRPALEPFATTALGGFPYYWQDPSTLLFNPKTYAWISANLRANATPAELDLATFPSYYLQALAAVQYGLSNADLARLDAAAVSSASEQLRLLNAWVSVYGSVPPPAGTLRPIDLIMEQITTSWASPPTTLLQLQQAPKLADVLNTAPAKAQAILPVLADYLRALGSTVPLQNAASMYRGYLAQALQAVQFPSVNNGALMTSDRLLNPAYSVAPAVAEILSGLNATTASLRLAMTISRVSPSGYAVRYNGGPPQGVQSLDLLAVQGVAPWLGLAEHVDASTEPVQLDLVFAGVTLLDFSPVPYDPATGKNWFWMAPIQEAIRNGAHDVSGFRFSPAPQIEFGRSGPFGLLTRVAITQHPSIAVTSVRPDYRTVQQDLQTRTTAKVSVAGQSPAQFDPAAAHRVSATVDDSKAAVTVRFDPPPDPRNVDSTAFVVGVNTCYPAA